MSVCVNCGVVSLKQQQIKFSLKHGEKSSEMTAVMKGENIVLIRRPETGIKGVDMWKLNNRRAGSKNRSVKVILEAGSASDAEDQYMDLEEVESDYSEDEVNSQDGSEEASADVSEEGSEEGSEEESEEESEEGSECEGSEDSGGSEGMFPWWFWKRLSS